MREIIITRREAGQRFDRFLGKYMPEASSGFLHKMLRKKNIKLNGAKAEGNEKVQEGDRIQIFFSEETLEKFCGNNIGEKRTKPVLTKEQKRLRSQVKVLFASKDVLVLHKPAGMLTQKAAKEDDSLNDYLIDYCLEKGYITEDTLRTFRPSVANRLDRNTSGIVLCGITIAGLQSMGKLLKERELEKYYLCLVKGFVSKDKKIKGYLTKNEKENIVTLSSVPVKGALPIETWYQVIKANSRASFLKVRLITGKTHQIRAHLAAEGTPILGDYKYGDRQWNERLRRETGVKYQMLHSYELRAPKKGEGILEEMRGMRVIDPVPDEFAAALKKWNLMDSSYFCENV